MSSLVNTNNNNTNNDHTTTHNSTSNIAAISRIKPTVHKRGNTNAKKIKFHSTSCMDTTQQETAFHPLDVTVPQQAHKIQQRQKTIAKGKNTIGYDEYRKQVPLYKRHKFSMETPSTPDPTLDIPNKQWNGMVKAWRIALHKYDPVDLQQSFAKAHAEEQLLANNQPVVSDGSTPSKSSSSSSSSSSSLTVKEQELEQAKSMGLLDLVQLDGGNDAATTTAAAAAAAVVTSTFSQDESVMQMETNTTALGITDNSKEMSILDEWEQQAKANGEDDDLLSDGGDESDDDDDLL
ncbi:histone RNA hairpin-binding domain containing protein [Nitzschia inconspicua]|uniref:Histone RNA hairpin-binding domain containing protein n=1 Tax=Nitzschia inconspicua TaxID=303405 RepID=A0A9K3LPB9_9STRA|nr:histone RNA hairpin-binding domain containing protein [Nitzschia inconspicua]